MKPRGPGIFWLLPCFVFLIKTGQSAEQNGLIAKIKDALKSGTIAVGENIRVAPRASLTYFAVPMWERDNKPYIDALKKIFEFNRCLPEKEQIRVVSISTGVFSGQPHYDEWKRILEQADAQGILVVTCDQAILDYGILSLRPGENPDEPKNYDPGKYSSEGDRIRVPGANKTLASHLGIEVYTFDREGGMSWGAPYIAGLAPLAFQADPGIQPKEIIRFLLDTTTRTESGPVVNPLGFIHAVQEKRLTNWAKKPS
jgi:serine protease AprX